MGLGRTGSGIRLGLGELGLFGRVEGGYGGAFPMQGTKRMVFEEFGGSRGARIELRSTCG